MNVRVSICALAGWVAAVAARAGTDAPAAPSEAEIPLLDLRDIPAASVAAEARNPEGFLPAPTNVAARELMESVVARFPREPLIIEGDFVVRQRRGVEIQESPFRMTVHWGATPARASYALLDALGRPVEELDVSREAGRPPVVAYRSGGREAPAPNLYEPVRNTDLSWMDLTFSFLWWEGGSVLGMDRVKGYACYVVDLPAPTNAVPVAAAPARLPAIGPSRPYQRVRVWVEEKIRVMLQAEAYDARGEAIRRIVVQSCKKINDRWMVKDMEIQGFPEVHRTLLTVRDVRPAEEP